MRRENTRRKEKERRPAKLTGGTAKRAAQAGQREALRLILRQTVWQRRKARRLRPAF